MTGRGRRAAALGIAITALVVSAAASNHLHFQADLTAGQALTLGPETRHVVDAIHQQTTVIAFLARTDPDRAPAASLLSRYHRENPRLAFRVVDPSEAPGDARRFDIDPTFGGLVVTSGTRTEHATSASEQEITSAIARVERARTSVACIAGGHGEPSPDDTTPGGVAALRGLLVTNGFAVKGLDLLADPHVDPACDALVVVNPTAALGPAQDAISRYLAGGGNALVLNDPASTVDLSPILQPFGMTVVHGLVLEGDDGAHLPGDPLSIILHSFASSSPVVRNLPPVVLSTTEAVLTDPAPERGLSVASIAFTSQRSFLSRRPADTGTRFDSKVDLRGPISVGGAADQVSRSADGTIRHLRVVALGDADLATNAAIGEAGNSRLLLQAMDWLTLADDLVSVHTHVPSYRPLALTTARLRYLRAVTAGGIPLLYLLAGGMVWAWRRGR